MIDMAKLDAFIATIDDGLRVRPQDCVRGKCGNLVAMIEARISNVQERRALCQLLADAQPSQSKWFDAGKPGQAELYDAVERTLMQLKHFTPHSLPFLHRVSRKDVPDYYDVVKRPMDLGTMFKKVKSFAYTSRAQVLSDLELIYENCFIYNTDPDSPFRRHVVLLKDRWQVLMSSVPDITIGIRDDIDSLINVHLDQLDEEEASSSSMSHSPSVSASRNLVSAEPSSLKSFVGATMINGENGLSIPFPERSSLGMQKYNKSRLSKEHVELSKFHQCFPDNLHISREHPQLQLFGEEVSESMRRRCENMRQLSNPSMELGPVPLRFSVLPPASSMTPLIAKRALQSRTGWILIESGFQAQHASALIALGDLASELIQDIWKSVKMYMERGISGGGGGGDVGLVRTLARSLINDHFRNGPSALLKFFVDEQERIDAKLERAVSIIQERRYQTFLEEGGGSESPTEAIPEEEVDLDLLGDPATYSWPYAAQPGEIIDKVPASDQPSETTPTDTIESGPEDEPSLRELLDGTHTRPNGIERKRSHRTSPLNVTPLKRPRSPSDE